MTEASLQNFKAYVQEIAQKLAANRISEANSAAYERPLAQPDERLAQCIWFDRLFTHEGLKTDSGKDLEVLQAGRWNLEEGPDFRDAKIRIEGKLLRGDIEVHLDPEGWRQHRHHLNPVYNKVVLHVSLWKSASGKEPRYLNAEGLPFEGFTMESVLFPDFESIRQTIRVEDYPYQTPSAIGRCQPLMCSEDADYIGGLLDAAGRERLTAKAERLADQAAGESLDQVLYQALMTSMGHKANKGLFFLLSKRAPLSELTDYVRDIVPAAATSGSAAPLAPSDRRKAVAFFQSTLLHVAQLAPAEGFEPEGMDDEMRLYLEEIREHWGAFSGYFSDRIIPPTKQWTTGARPVNFAHRRIAGVAHLLGRWFLAGGALEAFAQKIQTFDPSAKSRARQKWIRRELIDAFVVEDPEAFWTWRYNFTAKRAARGMKLIGESRASSIVFNALLPLLLHRSRVERNHALEDLVREIYAIHPTLESNSIVRHMRARLFGEDEARAKTLLTTESRQQGLFQIFASCCNHNELGCEDCYYQKVHT